MWSASLPGAREEAVRPARPDKCGGDWRYTPAACGMGPSAAPSGPAPCSLGLTVARTRPYSLSAGAGRTAALSRPKIALLGGLERFPSRACQLPGATGMGERWCKARAGRLGATQVLCRLPIALNHCGECDPRSVDFSDCVRTGVRCRGG